MSKEREKELKKLIYLKSEIIKEAKKELKQYSEELKKLESKNNYFNKPKKIRKK